ncbi:MULTISPECIES: hypothetical protein [Halomonadaceae]|uniref:DUF4297 domain-containing protein n=2 Tax=root TaxID=1 RepID=A0A7Z0SN95_9GAMM|nr:MULTISPECIES: hypothetical protein [Halomonas]QGQ69914.1 hypothetical protein FDY98_07225 [Halomonas sp. PA16-9]NVE92458.1 hypothetical protein [Halomonas titanicae]NYT74557.1 hypothetical protein [Halomonas sedimenti]TMU25800.1 hypothetical protein E0L35_07990 [Halomonas sp. ATBC28]CAD5268986.1 conserved hypothetical protein [Halomonas sp. 156]
MVDQSVNAGVRAQQGFALQRNMALFIILDNYQSKFDGAKYFLSLEHLEDILFCYLDDHGKAVKVETYQSKKKSNGSWKIGVELAEIIVKILQVGKSLIIDEYPKCCSYSHDLYFSSNTNIQLEKKVNSFVDNKKQTRTYAHAVNEENSEVIYGELDPVIQNAITTKLELHESYNNDKLFEQLENLKFLYIDFNRTNKEQENQLRSKIEDIFDRKVSDSKAALESIFRLFKDIELTYNQKSIARLSDKTKQIQSKDINNAIKIITTKSKAFQFWRDHKREVGQKLGIKPFERETFEMKFILAFDLFKSKDEAEHQKILNFVKLNYLQCNGFSEDGCIEELVEKFNNEIRSSLDDQTLKATMYAAYFEAINKMDD